MINATVLKLNSLTHPANTQNTFYNKYASEIQLVLSAESIEYGLSILTQLKPMFPNLAFVHVVYFYSFPQRKKLLFSLENERLQKFAVNLKKDEVGVAEFGEVFNQFVFQGYPVVQFHVEVIYQRGSLMSKQLVSPL